MTRPAHGHANAGVMTVIRADATAWHLRDMAATLIEEAKKMESKA